MYSHSLARVDLEYKLFAFLVLTPRHKGWHVRGRKRVWLEFTALPMFSPSQVIRVSSETGCKLEQPPNCSNILAGSQLPHSVGSTKPPGVPAPIEAMLKLRIRANTHPYASLHHRLKQLWGTNYIWEFLRRSGFQYWFCQMFRLVHVYEWNTWWHNTLNRKVMVVTHIITNCLETETNTHIQNLS